MNVVIYVSLVNCLLLFLSSYTIKKLTSSFIIAFLVFVYFGIFLCILPLYYSFSKEFLSVNTSIEYLTNYSLCTFIFSITFLIVILFMKKAKISIDLLIPHSLLIRNIRLSRLLLMCVLFFLISYISNVLKFNNIFYFLSSYDQFEIVQRIKVGEWTLQVLSSLYIYAFLLLIYILIPRLKRLITVTVLGIMLSILAIFFFKASNRTGIFVIFLTIYTYYFNFRKKERFSILFLVVCLGVFILTIGNSLRHGKLNFNFKISNLENFLIGFTSNFFQVENGAALIEYFQNHEFYYFKILFLVISGYALIPSKILPFEKINTGFEYLLTKQIFGYDLNPIFYFPDSTLTFSIPCTGYADLGYVGVFVHSLIYSCIFSLVLNRLSKKQNDYIHVCSLYLLFSYIFAYRLSVQSVILGLYLFLIFYFLTAIIMKFNLRSHKSAHITTNTSSSLPSS